MLKNRQSKQQQLRNKRYMIWSKSAVLALSLHKTLHANVRLLCAAMLMPAAMLLTGCASNPTLPCKTPEPLMLPALSQPLPKQSYSISAQESIKRWQGLLTPTPATSQP